MKKNFGQSNRVGIYKGQCVAIRDISDVTSGSLSKKISVR